MIRNSFRNVGLALVSVALATVPSPLLAAWSFTVTNSTSEAITELQAREAGTSEWGAFAGSIGRGETATFEWGSGTDNSKCNWEVRAVYSGGTTGDPGTFNFCEKTELVF